ncbi:MAG: family 10 glycosylhydrolase [Eubacterium sp.]|nr:family 10 glycosylhydrolase [Eubacterium sp.]
MIKRKSENDLKKSIKNAFKKVKRMGFNTVTVQIRPFADAFYKSKYFPTSEYITEKQGDEIEYDPLLIMCETAKSLDLKIEAWINPYRISNGSDINKLSGKNIAKKWYKGKKKNNVYVSKSGIFFNPASDDVINLIVNGVKEIVSSYSIDAIHFDDYFYPTKDKEIDKTNYKKYKGKLSLADFRREKVSNMIKKVYKAIKSINPDVQFGISPAANIKEDYNNLYADVTRWAKEEGYCDYICPQVYFGFKNVYQPFMFTVKKWVSITEKELYIGLPLYKAGLPDKYAAQENKSNINEFVNNNNIIARQIEYVTKIGEIKGYYVFSYGCLEDERCKKEVDNMLKVMK